MKATLKITSFFGLIVLLFSFISHSESSKAFEEDIVNRIVQMAFALEETLLDSIVC